MALRDELQKRIDRKHDEIRELEIVLREAQSYLAALQDMAKLLPRESNDPPGAEQILRPGSAVAKARAAIKKIGKPLHISEILKAIDLEPDKKNRLSLSGSLSGYARRGEIFTRPAPNTFGILELSVAGLTVEELAEPPAGFGLLTKEDERIADNDAAFNDDESF